MKVNKSRCIDEWGQSYSDAKNQEREHKKCADEIVVLIKKAAEEAGVSNGKKRCLMGSKYEIGYIEAEPSPKIDVQVAEDILSPNILRKCMSLDSSKIAQAAERGEIPSKCLRKILIPGKTQRRVFVNKL